MLLTFIFFNFKIENYMIKYLKINKLKSIDTYFKIFETKLLFKHQYKKLMKYFYHYRENTVY